MKKAWLLAVILMLALGLMLTGCAPAADDQTDGDQTDVTDASWDQIVEKGYFIVGLDDAFPPMGFRDENNDIVGFDIDLARAAAAYLGVEVQFLPVDWSTVEMSLNNGDIDCIWNGYSITEDRKLVVDYGTPYVASTQIIVTLTDSDIATKADLAGKIVGTQMGSSTIVALDAEPEVRDSFGELKQYATFTEAIMDLQNSRVDAVVIDSIAFYGDFNVKAPDAYKVLDEDFGEEQMGIGFRQADDAFTAKLNEALAAIQEDGTAAEISNTWFGEDILIL